MTTNVNAKVLLDSTTDIKAFYKKMAEYDDKQIWVRCPLCHDEYLKLRPCRYLDEGQEIVTYVCVNCAEGVDVLPQIERLLPTLGVEINIKKRKIGFHLKPVQIYRTHKYAEVKYGELVFYVSCKSSPPYIMVEDRGTNRFFDNIYQAWSYIRKILIEGENKVIETW